MFNIKKTKVVSIRNWWGGKFPLMACEEMGELMKAVSKAERLPESQYRTDHWWGEPYTKLINEGNEVRENLIEELADVFISVKVLASRYGITDKEIQAQLDRKVAMEKTF